MPLRRLTRSFALALSLLSCHSPRMDGPAGETDDVVLMRLALDHGQSGIAPSHALQASVEHCTVPESQDPVRLSPIELAIADCGRRAVAGPQWSPSEAAALSRHLVNTDSLATLDAVVADSQWAMQSASHPGYSPDRRTAVLMVSSRCGRRCGRFEVVAYVRRDQRWERDTVLRQGMY